MAGILVQGIWVPPGLSAVVIIPPIGDADIGPSGAFIHQPGVGTHVYAIECKLADGTETTLPRTRRRVLFVRVVKK